MILSHTGLLRDSSPQPYIPLSGAIRRGNAELKECCGSCGGQHHAKHSSRDTCFCNRNFAAYSSTCTCGGPRSSALFATSSELREEALNIFYGRNNFAVTGPEASAIIRQINSVPSDQLRRVKRLRIHLHNMLGFGLFDSPRSEDLYREYDNGFIPEKPGFWENVSKLLLDLHTLFQPDHLDVEFLVGGHSEEELDERLHSLEVNERKRVVEKFCTLVSGYSFHKVAVSVDIDHLPDLWPHGAEWKSKEMPFTLGTTYFKPVTVFGTGVELNLQLLGRSV